MEGLAIIGLQLASMAHDKHRLDQIATELAELERPKGVTQ
jgi:hypothetical protein